MHNHLPSKDPQSMLTEQAERIDEIKTAAGVSTKVFDHFYQPVLRAFAEATQTLPLSNTVFKQQGGAFEFGLYACMVALRVAKSQVFFPEVIAEDRRVLDPQCRYAAFVATLASAVAMLAENVSLHVSSNDDDYHALVTPVSLACWLRNNPMAVMRWRVGAQPLTAAQKAAIAARFIPGHLLQNFDLRVVLMIFGAIAPQGNLNGVETPLERVVRQTIAKILEHYAQEDQKRYEVANDAPTINTRDITSLAERMVADAKPLEPTDITKPAPKAAAAIKPAATAATVAAEPLLSTEAYMAQLPKAVREWFAAVVSNPNYEIEKTHLVVTEMGVEMPAAMLGKYGVAGPTVRQMLESSNVILGRSADGRGFVLNTAVKGYLLPESDHAA